MVLVVVNSSLLLFEYWSDASVVESGESVGDIVVVLGNSGNENTVSDLKLFPVVVVVETMSSEISVNETVLSVDSVDDSSVNVDDRKLAAV